MRHRFLDRGRLLRRRNLSEDRDHPRDTHLVFNYPDGNQQRLAAFIAAQAGDQTKLCVLSHDRTLELDGLALQHRHDVRVKNEPPWQMSIYGMPGSADSSGQTNIEPVPGVPSSRIRV